MQRIRNSSASSVGVVWALEVGRSLWWEWWWWCGVSYTFGFWLAKFRKALDCLESMARIYSVKGSIRISNLDIGGMRASLAYRVPPGHAYEAKVSPMKDYFMDDSRFG